MSNTISFLRQLAGRLARDTRGNVALLFAFTLVPLLAMTGAAVDYTRANSARTALQTALDSTALMLSKDVTSLNASQIQSTARTYFDALYDHPEAPISNFTVTYTPNTGKGATVLVTANGAMQTNFMKVLGSSFNQLNIGSSSTTTWGANRMRVAMVLDNTGSMSDNGKMAALQSAATTMITQLSNFSTTTGDVYVSIVPFAKDVNVSTSNVSAAWLNWTEWEAEPPVLTQNNYPISVKYNGITYTWADIGPGAPCPFDTTNKGGTRPSQNSSLNKFSFACMDRPGTMSGATDLSNLSGGSTPRYLIPSTGTYSGMICPGLDGGTQLAGKYRIYYNGCYTSAVDTVNSKVVSSGSNASCSSSTPNCSCAGSGSGRKCTQTKYTHVWRGTTDAAPTHSTWAGCVNDRDQTYDTTNTAWSSGSSTPSTRYYAEQWADCLPATITPMSNSWSDLKTQISNMSPSGNTNQAVGLAWGWQTLNTANGPYQAPPKDANWVYKDYIVLLSDGLNTQNRWTQTASSIDARQEILCKNIKDPTQNGGNQITVFTIQVNINNADPKSQVLQDCASGPDNFQMITTSNQTATAFQNVLAQISKLRIAQ
jgi:Flp pilus assembly protein TadG